MHNTITLLKKIKEKVKQRLQSPPPQYPGKTVVFSNETPPLLNGLLGTYIGKGNKRPTTAASILDLNRWASFEDYFSNVRKDNYKSAIYPYNKSLKGKYYSQQFVFQNFLPDVVEINHSLPERQGRKMDENYKRSIEDFGPMPNQRLMLKVPANNEHFRAMFGVFLDVEGYEQGAVITNEKLVGYISFIREGNMAVYSQILGHGDHLKAGTMYNIHFHIMEWLYADIGMTNGIDLLMYGGHFDGGDGLRRWKEKLLFEPASLNLAT